MRETDISKTAVITRTPAQAGGLQLHVLLRTAPAAIHPLPPQGALLIGRSSSAAVCVEDTSVSRRHAVLHVGAQLSIEDLGSANGTWVRGARIEAGQRTPISTSEVVEVGSVSVVVQRVAVASVPRRLL